MLEREGVIGNAQAFWLLGRVLGKAGTLKVGVYILDRPLTPLELYAKIQRGDVSQAIVQFIEGWNWHEVQAELAAQPMLKNDSAGMSEAGILQAIGAEESHIEGLLFPDTYFLPSRPPTSLCCAAPIAGNTKNSWPPGKPARPGFPTARLTKR